MKRIIYLFIAAFFISLSAIAQTKLQGLLTETSITPIGIDEKIPKVYLADEPCRTGVFSKQLIRL